MNLTSGCPPGQVAMQVLFLTLGQMPLDHSVIEFVAAPGIFSAILGRGPRASLIGKISDVTQNLGIFQDYDIFQFDTVN